MAQTTAFKQTDTVFTASSQTLGPWDVTAYNGVTIAFNGTYSGLVMTPEVSIDGTTWYGVTVTQVSGSSTATTGTPGTNGVTAYELFLGAFTQFRIRSTAFTSGTANVQVSFSNGAIDPVPNVQISNSPNVGATPQATSGGVATNHHLVAAGTTNATSVKVTAGSIGNLVLCNTSAAIKFFKLFNKASAPTVGTDTPTVTIGIPAGTTFFWDPTNYYRMSTGIAYAITNLSPDLDATAVTAGDVIVSINYV